MPDKHCCNGFICASLSLVFFLQSILLSQRSRAAVMKWLKFLHCRFSWPKKEIEKLFMNGLLFPRFSYIPQILILRQTETSAYIWGVYVDSPAECTRPESMCSLTSSDPPCMLTVRWNVRGQSLCVVWPAVTLHVCWQSGGMYAARVYV